MTTFVEMQEKEFAAAERGFAAVKRQGSVGTGYFDALTCRCGQPSIPG